MQPFPDHTLFFLQGTESTVSKSTASKESKKSKRSKSKKDSETEQSEDETDLGFKSAPSSFLPELIQVNQEYQDVWKDKDESSNPMQLPDRDMIKAEKMKEVENEVRVIVDQAMRGKYLLKREKKREKPDSHVDDCRCRLD